MRREQGTIRISTQNRAKLKVPWARRLRDGDYVQVTVSDDGCGMPADVLRHAAEPFFTTKGEGNGAGLGLSQIHGFAHQVGGAPAPRERARRGHLGASLLSPRAVSLMRHPRWYRMLRRCAEEIMPTL